MMDKTKAAGVNVQDAPEVSSQERLIEQLRGRNAELENTNRLLRQQIAESRRAEISRRGR
jgi:hypothetical protein